METPFNGEYADLKPVGKNILLEILQEKAEEKTLPSGIIVPASRASSQTPSYAIVKSVGDKVEIDVHENDFVEINSQLYPNIVDAAGYGRYQLVDETQIVGVYKKL